MARPAQRPPDGDWRCWLFMGGRGAGKTRAGAEWLQTQLLEGGYGRAALVGPSLLDVREVMIEGVSGLRAIGDPNNAPIYRTTRRRLEWPNGAIAQVFSAEDPDSLRGPQFDVAWCDELGAWANGEAVWDNLMFALRRGDHPRVAATTTPRLTPLIKRLVSADQTVITKSRTHENAAFLSSAFLQAVEARYGGTTLGRQELDGELIEDPPGALWSRTQIELMRLEQAPDNLVQVIVAIDPPATKGAAADACGIISAARCVDGSGVILADASCQGLMPLDWAGRAASLARKCGAAEIVTEANQGGEMIREVLQLAGWVGAVRLVHARFSKAVRAGPIAALYAQGRVRHVGAFPVLEDEMCTFGTDAASGSPDRVDALVWALTVLLLEKGNEGPRVRRV